MPIHWLDSDGRYLCNKACGVTPKKRTRIPERVTCKNCLKQLK